MEEQHKAMEEKKKLQVDDLPEGIMLDILSQLPADSILQCECVCRAWCSLVRIIKHQPYFVKRHLHHQQMTDDDDLIDFFQIRGICEAGNLSQFHFVLDDRNKKYNTMSYNYKVRRINRPLLVADDEVSYGGARSYLVHLGSCNGLVCLGNSYRRDRLYSIYICNPVTREYINLPRDNSEITLHLWPCNNFGFGYLPARDEYKVVKMCCRYFNGDEPRPQHEVEVYTVGKDCGGGWRKKGEISIHLDNKPGVHANGTLYWQKAIGKQYDKNIVAFDLADEEFYDIQLPQDCRPNETYLSILAMGGHLCLLGKDVGQKSRISIWVMKNATTRNRGKACSWVKEFNIVTDKYPQGLKARIVPHAFRRKKGQVLVWDVWGKFLSCYDTKTEEFRLLAKATDDQEQGWDDSDPNDNNSWGIMVRHINSFVSLKSLGEENVRREVRVRMTLKRKASCLGTNKFNVFE